MQYYCDFCPVSEYCGTMISNSRLARAGYCGIHNARVQDEYDMFLVAIITTPEEQEALDEMIADEDYEIQQQIALENELYNALIDDVLWIAHNY